MEVLGYIASVMIGVSLGLIGSGGSILTVPVLVYLFSIDAVSATTYSLFIVGITASIGSVAYFRKGLVNIKTAMVFGAPSIITVFLTRAYLVPAIPSVVFTINSFVVTKANLLLLLFAALMIAASYSMIKKKNTNQHSATTVHQHRMYPLLMFEGMAVGVIAGLVGAGGGFLIIPALVLLSKQPMKIAIGTSLLIIAANSLIGFVGGSHETTIKWSFLLSVVLASAIGIFIGMALSKKIDGTKLKPAFGWFILTMGFYIIIKETIFKI